MPHDVSLIATLAAGFGLALVLGFAAARLRMPPLVGYLVAGILIGPATPGFVADVGLAAQLAEIGVMLLMFGVGLHFSLDDLMAVKRIAVPGAIFQIVVATALGMLAATSWGWSLLPAAVLGLCLSVASTVVLLRALEDKGQLDSVNGRIAVGWLVVEDLVMVMVLVLLPVVAGMLPAAGGGEPATTASGAAWQALGLTLAKVAAFIALMLVVGRRVFPRILWWIARTGSRELFTLCVVSAAVGVAFGAAKLFDVSFALGAFFAGMMMRESEFSHRAASESLPLRDAFAVLFFVSVGMLFDPSVVWTEPVTVGASLAQIGEFSFILAGLGVALGLMPVQGQSLVLAAALISIATNSALFAAIDPLRRWVLARSARARQLEARDDPLAQLPYSTDPEVLHDQVVIIGYGLVGRQIAQALEVRKIPFVVADQNRELVDDLRAQGKAAVLGDAAIPDVLIQAHIARAGVLVVTLSDVVEAGRMVATAKALNPSIAVVLGARNPQEAALYTQDALGDVFVGDTELAHAMTARAIDRLGQLQAR
jgi:CPA2 family monovalent cation:H+ antiporter-2